MFDRVAEYLRTDGWKDWVVLQVKSSAGVVWWIFQPGAAAPSVVGKCCTNAQGIEAGREECLALRHSHPTWRRLASRDYCCARSIGSG